MITFTTDSEKLARGLHNALAFIPATSRLPWVYFRVYPNVGKLLIAGTDGYAVGMATVALTDYVGPPEGAEFLVSKGKADAKTAEGAAGLERTVRIAGKGHCDVSTDGVTVEVAPMGGDALRADITPAPEHFAAFQALTDLMGVAEKRDESIPGVVCVDPALLARLSKVKADKAQGRMADLLFGDGPLDPVLVKVGPDFRGLVMPIDREVNGKNVGEDGLW
ncbi:hypothetical protein GCM10029963_28310 [Micromonospora andamanensis]|uniref:hypothetical protein n=1 Tax=Micromonospora andamanensis TaxID=1287068 RepID=UPI00194E0FC0|nr:hypothetical protein [Micromonospora andamanensis]GIJ38537.1 hypothetical protein Vwe01_18620 [Micromonospora andamanensis]